jgi:hypothetical protein
MPWHPRRSRRTRQESGLGQKPHRGRIYAVVLPACAPELNSTEYVRGHFKQHRRPNFTAKDIAPLGTFGRRQRRNLRRLKLIAAFWRQAELW